MLRREEKRECVLGGTKYLSFVVLTLHLFFLVQLLLGHLLLHSKAVAKAFAEALRGSFHG